MTSHISKHDTLDHTVRDPATTGNRTVRALWGVKAHKPSTPFHKNGLDLKTRFEF